MIDILPPGAETNTIECLINDAKGSLHQSRLARDRWEADLPYDLHYDAKLQRTSRFRREIVPLGQKQFDVNSPHHIVKVP